MLFYACEISRCSNLTWHERRVLGEVSPSAIYVVNGKTLVAFFDDLHLRVDSDVQRKLWNAQIPLVISDEGNIIKIYNGRDMELNQLQGVELVQLDDYDLLECNESNKYSYWNITNQKILEMEKFRNREKNLNESLIENLRFITNELKINYRVSYANQLILRILFIRYLIDRGISIGAKGLTNNVEQSQQTFLEIVKNKEELFELFEYLKVKFNGNLFDITDDEMKEINDSILKILYDFLTAKIKLPSGQLCLFPFYDFNIIPIEIISSIYEILLGYKKQKKDKAFYTPEYLVDYIVEQTVESNLHKYIMQTVFDPSCGSGIFLVKSLRRILEVNACAEGYIQDKAALSKIVEKTIYGVDYNEEAVDVTIFSLYITLFDYQNPKDLTEFKLPLLKGKNIFFSDFFDDRKLKIINGMKFDYIIGNPPWGRMDNQENYKDYSKRNNFVLPEGEISTAFLMKVQDFANRDTKCCLVVPAKILYKGKGPSQDFRKKLFTKVQLSNVLELSAVRKEIFKDAIAPAVVLNFSCTPASETHKTEYISLKPNKYLRLFNIIMIEPDDVKYVNQSLLLEEDWVWKVLVYGSYWDYELICSLREKLPSVACIIKKNNLLAGKGIQDHPGDGEDASHLLGRKLVSSDGSVEHFYLNLNDVEIFDKPKIHRPRKKGLFEPPYVFFKKGLDCADYSIRAVYSEERLVYKEAVNCIKGEPENKTALKNLAGLLNSSLFSYFNLLLGSSAGIEREQVFLTELKKYPYVYSENLVSLVTEIQAKAKELYDIEELQKKIDLHVLEMYDLKENWFVDYILKVQIPMLCKRYQMSFVNGKQMEQYKNIFYDTWKGRMERNNLNCTINVYPRIKGKFAAFEMIIDSKLLQDEFNIIDEVDEDIELLTRLMIFKKNDLFYQMKDVAEFRENSFLIVKTNEMKNWHPSKAIKDSHSVLNAILQGEVTENERV